MKRFLILCILFFFLYKGLAYENNAIHTNAQFVEVQPIKNEIYNELTVRFISPYVHEAVNSHYQAVDSLTQNLNTAPSLMRIVEVKRVGEAVNFEFMITVEATSFVGENVPVADGLLTFGLKGPVSGGGENSVFFLGYKQLKTYVLPQEWKHIIKKPLE
ncbi:DUF3888 domain-containing protein [Psychrobacillus psychrodurans]|uniref:DUF3888 domain-containing protein n=1 Tax=Psychrobacillus psychrodurans TaxID=126157 RepID=A0A9X3RBK4_9BACI|nr:DUF3888 domain-containing protein [Psychrobacillus psychrodurans]MCZ8535321.1 DUF3888 domain-containing protein [Psychrobacillus psychrodurans]